MKLQVRCQLPFETKHSPNPGKTELVPGIRANKEEPKGEWQRSREEERRRRFYGLCWQYGISIKGPNSALNYPPALAPRLAQLHNHRLFGRARRSSPGEKVEKGLVAGKKKNLHLHYCFYLHRLSHVEFFFFFFFHWKNNTCSTQWNAWSCSAARGKFQHVREGKPN